MVVSVEVSMEEEWVVEEEVSMEEEWVVEEAEVMETTEAEVMEMLVPVGLLLRDLMQTLLLLLRLLLCSK